MNIKFLLNSNFDERRTQEPRALLWSLKVNPQRLLLSGIVAVLAALLPACAGDSLEAGGSAGGTGLSACSEVTTTSTEFSAQAIAEINRLRCSIDEPNAYQGSWAPLPPMVADADLIAGARAIQGQIEQSGSCDTPVNLPALPVAYQYLGLSGGPQLSAVQAVSAWAPSATSRAYIPILENPADRTPYLQLVWRRSVGAGCAIAECPPGRVAICLISPPGNVIGAPPY